MVDMVDMDDIFTALVKVAGQAWFDAQKNQAGKKPGDSAAIRVIAKRFNGFKGDQGACFTTGTHAEIQLLKKLKRLRNEEGAKVFLYTYYTPCTDCMTQIIELAKKLNECNFIIGFKKVWPQAYRDLDSFRKLYLECSRDAPNLKFMRNTWVDIEMDETVNDLAAGFGELQLSDGRATDDEDEEKAAKKKGKKGKQTETKTKSDEEDEDDEIEEMATKMEEGKKEKQIAAGHGDSKLSDDR